MTIIAYITPTAYWLALIPAAAAITWLFVVVTKRAKFKHGSSHSDPILRLYESRLLSTCSGNKAEVRRLIDIELKRRPGISRLDAVRHAHYRLKKRMGRDVWSQHHAF